MKLMVLANSGNKSSSNKSDNSNSSASNATAASTSKAGGEGGGEKKSDEVRERFADKIHIIFSFSTKIPCFSDKRKKLRKKKFVPRVKVFLKKTIQCIFSGLGSKSVNVMKKKKKSATIDDHRIGRSI